MGKEKDKKKGLGKDQKDFIEKKVKEIGKLEEVKTFYNLDDEVSKYALKVAKNLKLK